MAKPCGACADSGRPGYLVFTRYYDRAVPTDVIGEMKMTSGIDYIQCFVCGGTARAIPDALKLDE